MFSKIKLEMTVQNLMVGDFIKAKKLQILTLRYFFYHTSSKGYTVLMMDLGILITFLITISIINLTVAKHPFKSH
jgi:hypothetical protein